MCRCVCCGSRATGAAELHDGDLGESRGVLQRKRVWPGSRGASTLPFKAQKLLVNGYLDSYTKAGGRASRIRDDRRSESTPGAITRVQKAEEQSRSRTQPPGVPRQKAREQQ